MYALHIASYPTSQFPHSHTTLPLKRLKADALPGTPSALETAMAPEPAYCGCGWFDSSYELHTGLQVSEDQDPSLLQLWAMVLSGSMTRH